MSLYTINDERLTIPDFNKINLHTENCYILCADIQKYLVCYFFHVVAIFLKFRLFILKLVCFQLFTTVQLGNIF